MEVHFVKGKEGDFVLKKRLQKEKKTKGQNLKVKRESLKFCGK